MSNPENYLISWGTHVGRFIGDLSTEQLLEALIEAEMFGVFKKNE